MISIRVNPPDLLSRKDEIGKGSATVPVALFGVSPNS